MVIDVPVKVGFSVIQANNFNPGTTIAVVADMDDMIFEGRVDEAEVAKIKEGMKLAIKVGAIEKEHARGQARVHLAQGQDDRRRDPVRDQGGGRARSRASQIRANYSANADIVLDEKKQVLAIREALVQYDERQAVRRGRDRAADVRQEGRQARPLRRHQGRGPRRASPRPTRSRSPRPRARRAPMGPGGRQAAAEEVSSRRSVTEIGREIVRTVDARTRVG